MVITDSSLSQVNRELIDKRVYKEGLITTVGTPTVVNGLASNISNSNYFTSSNFSFSNNLHNVKITFKGLYVPELLNHTSFAYELTGGSSQLSLEISSNSIMLKGNNVSIKQFTGLTFKSENEISTSIIITNTYTEGSLESQECAFTIILNGIAYTDTVLITDLIDFSSLNSLVLGNNQSHNGYWEGNIDLAAFALYQNNSIIYTPSAKNNFKFTKIIVADPNYSLTDNSTPVLHHVYECPVTEISRTENNVLLTATIPEDAYLNIAQLGLYYEDDLGTHLFSTIGGLAIKKTGDLVYNLIIHVKLDINVVNTVAMPEVVVKDKPYINFSKFLTVKQVYAYITENLERMIKTNALGIGSYTNGAMTEAKPVGVGYNKAQVYYRMQNDLALWEDNFVATNDYAKVRAKFTLYTTESFNPELITKEGDVFLSNEGILSVFSNYNYGYANNLYLTSNNWKFTTTFTTGGNISTEQSIVTFSSEAVGQPLTLGIDNYKCTLKMDAKDEALVSDGTITHLFTRGSKVTLNNSTYYSWVTNDNITNKTILTTIYTGITSSTPVYSITGELLSGWQFNQQINSNIIDTQLFNVNINTEYKVSVEYENGVYHISYVVNNTEHSNIYSVASNKKLNNIYRTLFGVGYDGTSTSSPFSGQVNLYKTSLETSNYANGTVNEQTYNFLTTTTYDKELLDYFHLPIYAHSYFHVNNLGFEGTSYLEEYEGAFKGYYDRVYFNNPKGFTLCAKVHLHDEKGKILLAKGNVNSDEYYFILEQSNNSLRFTLYLDEATVVLSKEFTVQTIRSFIEHPINITITCDGNQYSPTFKMYKNNELLDTFVLPTNSTKNVSNMYLMNHEALTGDEDLGVHTVHDIMDFEGELTPADIYYINNILDTNF